MSHGLCPRVCRVLTWVLSHWSWAVSPRGSCHMVRELCPMGPVTWAMGHVPHGPYVGMFSVLSLPVFNFLLSWSHSKGARSPVTRGDPGRTGGPVPVLGAPGT